MTTEPSASSPSEEALESSSQNGGGSALRFIIPALILIAGVYFGLRAFQSNTTEDGSATASPQQQPPSPVVVVPLVKERAQNTHRIIGTLRATERSDLAAREEGALQDIYANEGDSVEKGDILVRLDARRLEALIAEAQANVTVARALISQREAEAGRNETDLSAKTRLYDQQAISESEYLDAQRESSVADSRGKSARDALAAASAALQLLEVRRDDLVIRAPFDARVVAREVEAGEWVRPGDTLFTLVSRGRFEAWMELPERFSGMVQTGALDLEIGGETTRATNLRLLPQVDPTSRGLTIIADLEDPQDRLVPGLSVSAELAVSDDEPRLMVPNDAIVTTFAGPAVFRAKQGGDGPSVAERLAVEVLFQREGRVFLKSPALAVGDLLVVEGNERLFPGTPLSVTQRPVEDPASRDAATASPESL